MDYKLYIVGIGPGHPDYMLPIGLKLIAQNNTIVGSKRALATFANDKHETYSITSRLNELVEFLKLKLKTESVVVLVSGDPGYYSLLNYLKKYFNDDKIEVIPGISSINMAFSKLKESWYDAKLMSFHGRMPTDEDLIYKMGQKVAFLTDKNNSASNIANALIKLNWPKELKAVACERLSYDDEYIFEGKLSEIVKLQGFTHAVLVVFG